VPHTLLNVWHGFGNRRLTISRPVEPAMEDGAVPSANVHFDMETYFDSRLVWDGGIVVTDHSPSQLIRPEN